MGKKAQGKNKAQYDRQRGITGKHKSALVAKRAKKLAFWIAKGVKKNGKPVIGVAERKDRLFRRKELRAQALDEIRAKRRSEQAAWKTHANFQDRKDPNGRPGYRKDNK